MLLGDTDLDGDSLTVTEIDGTPLSLGSPVTIATGVVSLNADGTLTFTANANYNGPAAFDYTLSDGNGGTDSGRVSGNVTPVNDPPVADDETFTVAEDGAVIIDVITGDTDLDGDTLTVTEIDGTPISVGNPVTIATGLVSLNADGTLTFTPNANDNGPAAFDYTVSDGNGGTDNGHVSGTVTPVNDAPVARDNVYVTDEDSVVSGNVLTDDTGAGVDSDIDGDSLSVSLTPVVDVTNGSLVLAADGSFTYTPNLGFNGYDSFTYELRDPGGLTSTAVVMIAVGAVNDPPVADDETFTVAEDGAVIIDVLLGDTDLDGDTLTATEIDGTPISVGSPVTIVTGVVSLNADGTLTFTPNANFNGPASFDYTVSDGNGGTDIGHVSGTVTPVNDPPVADDETFVVAEDGAVIIPVLLGDTDLDGDTLTVTDIDGTPISLGSPVTIATGVVSLNADGTLTFTPNPNFNGPAAFDYTLSDGNGGSDVGHVSGNVTPVNDAPTARINNYTTAEDMTVNGNVLTDNTGSGIDSDVDGDSLSVTLMPVVDVMNGLLVLAGDGSFTYTPNLGFNGVDSFTYEIRDPGGLASTAVVTIAVGAVNDPPVADDDTFTVAEDSSVIIPVLTGDMDQDGDTLTVTEIDGMPISIGSPVTIATGVVSLNADGTLTFTPNANFNGPAAFDYTVSDGNGGSDIGHVSGSVTPVNDPPVADDETFSVAEDTSVIIDVITGDTDLDGDTLTVSEIDGTPLSLGNPVSIATGVVSLNADGTLTFTPNGNYNGPAAFDYTVSDNNGGTDVGHVSGTVTPVNDPPVADDESFTVAEDSSVIIDVLLGDTDLDGDTLTVSEIDGTPINIGSPVTIATGIVGLNADGTLTFTPNANFNGSTSFDYTVNDGNGGTDSGHVIGNVTPVNDPPVADDETFTVAEDSSVIIDVLLGDTDLDGDMLAVTEIDGTPLSLGSPVTIATGVVSLNADGTLTFTPNLNFNGPAAFDYTLSDGNGGTDIGRVSGNVTPVNDPPVADDETFTVAEDNSVNIDVLLGDTDLDGDTLSVSEIDGTPISVGTPVTIASGVVSLNVDGTLTFTPNANYNGPAAFDYTLSDGNGGTDIGHVSGNVTPVNDPPVADDETFTVAEDSSVIIDVLTGDTDLDGDTLSVSEIDGTPISVGTPVTIASGVVSLNVDGTLSFTPNANFNGPASFDYTLSDGQGGTDIGHVSGTVTPVNDPPIADDETFTVAEEGNVIIPVLLGDTDLDGDTLTVTDIDGTPISVGSPVTISTGLVSLNADGTLTFTPNANFNGPAAFDYTISDGQGGSDSGHVSGNVTPVNDPPVADDETFTLAEDSSVIIDVITGDTDLDGDTLSVTDIDGTPISVGSPVMIATGLVSLNADGTLTFTPNADFNGPVAFDYTVSDGNGGTDIGHVSGTVTPVNDPPIADDESFTVAEDGVVIIPVLSGDTDLDGDTLTVSEIDGTPISISSPVTIATGVVSLNADGTLTFTPNANFNGPVAFDYTVSDGNGGSDVGNVSGTVTPVNDPPVADDETFTVAEDSSVIIDVITGDTDLDGDTLTVSEIDGAAINVGSPVTIATGLVSLNTDGTLTFTPNANYNGPVAFDYTLSDGNSGSDIGHVSGTVTPVNDPPVADNESFTVAEDGAVIIDVLTGDTDLDGDTLSVSEIDGTPISVGSPVTIANGVVSLNADGTLTFTPNANFHGPAAFDYTLSDGNGGTDSGNVSGTVTPVNDPPVADDESFSVAEDGSVIIDVLTGDTDLDGDSLSVSEIDSTPISLGSPVMIATGVVSLNADGTLSFTPNTNFNGPAVFDYAVSDGQGGSDLGHVSGTVAPVNDPPVADDETFVVAEDSSVIIDVINGDTDLDGDTLSVSEIDGTPLSLGSPVTIATGVVSLNADDTLTFTPNANFNGPAAFDYTLSDGNGGSDIGHVSGTVTPVNDPPVADDETFTVAEDSSVIVPVLLGDTDLDGDTLTVTEIDGTPISLGSPVTISSGVVSLNADGTLTFTPNSNFNGPAAFDYTVSDGNGGSDVGSVSGTVTPVNDPPVADDETFVVVEDGSVIIDVLLGDTDLDGDTLTVTEIDGTPISFGSPVTIASGVVSLNADGTLTFTSSNPNFNGPAAFDYTVSDGNGGSDLGHVSGTVTPENDPPVADDEIFTVDEDGAVIIDVITGDTDLDGDTLTVTEIDSTPISVGSPVTIATGVVSLNADGTLTFTPNANFNGPATFDYTVADGNGGTDIGHVSGSVTPINDPPVADDETFTVAEDGSVVIPVLTGDTDLDGDTLTVTEIDGTPISIGSPVAIATGVVSLNADGTLTFTPNTNFNGPAAFDYTLSDGNGGTDLGHVSGTVTPVNDPPVADDETFTVAEDGAVIIDVLLGDTDLDGDTLTATEIDGTPISLGSPVTIATGVVSLNADGTLTFTPNANFNGPAAFDYTVGDGNGGTDTGHVSGNVTPVNDPPIADDETFTLAEDGAVIIPVLLGDTDLDDDTLSVTQIDSTPISVGSPVTIATGLVSLNADGTLTFTPNTNFNGPAAFDYTVSDGNGGSDVGSVSGTITPVNDPPVADDETFTVAEDGAVIIDVLSGDTDLDNDTLTVTEIDGTPISLGSPVTIATGVVSLNADGTLTFTPNANFNGPAAFDYTISDGNGGSDVGNVSGTITPVNDPPVADDETFIVAEDGSVIIDVLTGDTDLDGDTLTVTEIDGTPIGIGSPVTIAIGVVSLNADGTLSFTPNVNYNGPAAFDYTVSDSNGGTDVGHVSGNVTPVNDPPVADDETFTVAEDGSVVIPVLAGDTDLDGDTLTVTEIDGTPINLGSPVTIATGVVSLNADGTLTFTPNANFNGPAAFDYTVSDGNGGTDIGHVSGNVTPVNDPPIADDETFTLTEDGAVIIPVLLGDTDLDGDTLSVTDIDGTPISLGSPVTIATGLVSLNADSTLTFTPNANYNGPAAFDYTVSDSNGGSDVGHVSGNVMPVNDPPVADDETFTVAEDGSVIIPVLLGDTDLDGDTLSVTEIDSTPISVGSPVTIATGLVSLNADGTLTFTPNTNFNGPAAFDYTVSDGNGGSDVGHVSGNVTPVNDVPIARTNNYAAAEDMAVSGNVLTDNTGAGIDSDVDGDSLSVTTTPVVDVTNGLLVLAGDGSFTYTPNLGFNGVDSFTYEIRDPGGLASTAVVSIAVGAVNDPPVADDETFTVAEEGSVIIPVLIGDTDLDGDALFVTHIDGSPISIGSPVTIATGVVSLNPDGTLSFTPNTNFNGPAAFDYTVSDGNGGTDVGNVSGNVTPTTVSVMKSLFDSSNPITVGSNVTIGEELCFALLVTMSEGNSTDLILSDLLPDGLQYDSWTLITSVAASNVLLSGDFNGSVPAPSVSGGTFDGEDVSFTFGAITVGTDGDATNNSFVLLVHVFVSDVPSNHNPLTGQPTLTNIVTADVSNAQPPVSSNPFDVTVVEPDVSVTIDNGVAALTAGQTTTYSITIANDGDSLATGLVLSGSLPVDRVTFVATDDAAHFSIDGSGTFTWTPAVASLAPSGTLTLLLTVQVNSSLASSIGDVTIPVSVTHNNLEPTPANNSAADTDSLAAAPDLRLTKTDYTNSISPGQCTTYTLNVGNFGTQEATNVIVTETIPIGGTFNPALSDPAWTNVGGGVYQYSILSLPAGAAFNVNLSVLIDNPALAGQTQIINTATIADDGMNGPDLDPTNNSATDIDMLDALPMYDIGIDDLQLSAVLGESLTYYVNFNNYGLQNGTGVILSANFPTAILTNVVASNGGIVDAMAGTITWNVGALPANDPRTFEVTAEVRSTMSSGVTDFTLTAAIIDDGTNGPDPDLSDNSTADTDTLRAQPDYAITIDDGKTIVRLGDPLTYTIHVANNGNQDGSGVVVTVSFPSAVLENVVASNGGIVDAVAGTITWNLGSLAAGDSTTLTVSTRIRGSISSQTSSVTLTATVTDDGLNGPDPTPLNNLGRDLDRFQTYAYDGFHDWKDMRVAWLMPQSQTVGRPLSPLPVDPVFSGLTEPGSTLVARIYGADGRLLGDRQVVADAGGNWLITFPNMIIYEQPHRMEIIVTPAISNVSHENGFNLRRYFHPAIHAGLVMTESLSVAGVFRNRASNIVEAQHSANTHSLGFQWFSHAYELNAASSNISQM